MNFKFTNSDGRCLLSGIDLSAYLPGAELAGQFTPEVSTRVIQRIENYHVAGADRLARFTGDRLFEVETSGKAVVNRHVTFARQIKFVRELPWNADIVRQAACDFALFGVNAYSELEDAALQRRAILAVREGAGPDLREIFRKQMYDITQKASRRKADHKAVTVAYMVLELCINDTLGVMCAMSSQCYGLSKDPVDRASRMLLYRVQKAATAAGRVL